MEEQLSTVQKLIDKAIEFCVAYSFQVIGALIVLVLGGAVAAWMAGIFFKFSQKQKWDITFSKFMANVIRILIFAFAIIIALGKFGITIAPFIAALSAIAFGSTLALQGPLSNYMAGLTIVLGRPFRVGDTITVAGVSGVVQEVKLPATILLNEDGVKITIPNKEIVGQIIYNSSANQIVEAVIGVSYSPNPEKAIQIIRETLKQFSEVGQQPPPQIGIQAFADSSINISYRYWVPTVKFFQTSFAVNLAIYKALQAAGVTIPFPQREVRILSQTQPA